jgi:Werner syndrome ATP-dependent helicase
MELNTAYQKLYPDRTLKDIQIDIINNLIKGNDTLAILATGYGKSICYQLPFVYLNKTVIVISPLIALMEDQQMNLQKIGIPSICMNSNMSQSDKEKEKNLILDCDEHKIIYMTPEYLTKSEIFIKDLVSADKLCLVAIDEAHCISSWGHDFRKDYQQLCCLKEWTDNKVPVFACTATATPKVQKEIILYLQLNKPKIFKTSFDRKNLYIECKKKSNDIETDIYPYLEEYTNTHTTDTSAIIIYTKTRDSTEKICEIVQSLNISCDAYHGGLTPKKRKEIHTRFINGTCKCIVATIAFGMGIDQNVHLIIHYGLPSDMESYVQEIGRAGRDGKESKCILFWSDQDLHICRALLKDIDNEAFRKHKDEQLKLMDTWSRTNSCRKKILLKHFGESLSESCMKCDNCIKLENEKKKIYNPEPLYYPMFLIMKTLFTIKKKGAAIGRIIDIIRGSKNKNTIEFANCPTYSLANKYSIELLKEIIRLLIFNDYLREVSLENSRFGGSILMTTGLTIDWYNNAKKYKTEEEMGYISWPTFNIPESFETIYKYLPKNNTLQNTLKRRTLFQKTLDDLNLDENGDPINDDSPIILSSSNNINVNKLTIQNINLNIVDAIDSEESIKTSKIKKTKKKSIDTSKIPTNAQLDL